MHCLVAHILEQWSRAGVPNPQVVDRLQSAASHKPGGASELCSICAYVGPGSMQNHALPVCEKTILHGVGPCHPKG